MVGRRGDLADQESLGKVSLGELVIDEGTYTARLRGRPLDLTYKEFELLKYLAQHAGRVFTLRSCCTKYGGMTSSGAPGLLMCTCGGCGPNSAPSMKR